MAKKRKLDVDEKCSKPQKKPRKNTDEIRLQKHDLADPKNKSGETTKGDLPDIVTNCVLEKRKKKDSKLNNVDGVDQNGLSESGFAIETDNKATEVSSANKRNSCMKRTHQDKVKRKRRKHKAHKSATVKLPEAPEEISVNWKSLLKVRTLLLLINSKYLFLRLYSGLDSCPSLEKNYYKNKLKNSDSCKKKKTRALSAIKF